MNIKKVLLDNGEEIAYRERDGGEKPILLIHGNMTSSKHWDLLMEAFDSNYKLYAVDLRGFGFSSYRNRIKAIKDFSDDVKGFVDAIGLKNFSIIGWSTGGAVAMQFEIDYPRLCKKMVLLASGSTRGYPMFETNEDGTANGERRLRSISDIEQDSRTIGMQYLYDSKDREGLKAVWNAVIYTDKRPDEMKYEEYIDDMLTQRNLADVYHALNTFNISSVDNGINKGTNEAALIEIPILVLYGDRDYVVTEQMTKEIIEDLGHVTRFIRLKNTGHSPMIDDLQQVKTEMEKFID